MLIPPFVQKHFFLEKYLVNGGFTRCTEIAFSQRNQSVANYDKICLYFVTYSKNPNFSIDAISNKYIWILCEYMIKNNARVKKPQNFSLYNDIPILSSLHLFFSEKLLDPLLFNFWLPTFFFLISGYLFDCHAEWVKLDSKGNCILQIG